MLRERVPPPSRSIVADLQICACSQRRPRTCRVHQRLRLLLEPLHVFLHCSSSFHFQMNLHLPLAHDVQMSVHDHLVQRQLLDVAGGVEHLRGALASVERQDLSAVPQPVVWPVQFDRGALQQR